MTASVEGFASSLLRSPLIRNIVGLTGSRQPSATRFAVGAPRPPGRGVD